MGYELGDSVEVQKGACIPWYLNVPSLHRQPPGRAVNPLELVAPVLVLPQWAVPASFSLMPTLPEFRQTKVSYAHQGDLVAVVPFQHLFDGVDVEGLAQNGQVVDDLHDLYLDGIQLGVGGVHFRGRAFDPHPLFVPVGYPNRYARRFGKLGIVVADAQVNGYQVLRILLGLVQPEGDLDVAFHNQFFKIEYF